MSILKNKKAMWDLVGVLWGTVFTCLEIALLLFISNLAVSSIMNISLLQVFGLIDASREAMHQSVQGNSFLYFITQKLFLQGVVLLTVLAIWATNVNLVDKKRSIDTN
jgi:hypothetical protein